MIKCHHQAASAHQAAMPLSNPFDNSACVRLFTWAGSLGVHRHHALLYLACDWTCLHLTARLQATRRWKLQLSQRWWSKADINVPYCSSKPQMRWTWAGSTSIGISFASLSLQQHPIQGLVAGSLANLCMGFNSGHIRSLAADMHTTSFTGKCLDFAMFCDIGNTSAETLPQ